MITDENEVKEYFKMAHTSCSQYLKEVNFSESSHFVNTTLAITLSKSCLDTDKFIDA